MIFPLYLLIVTQRDEKERWSVRISSGYGSFNLPKPEVCDLDSSFAIKIGDDHEYDLVKKSITLRFFDYDTFRRDYPDAWKRRRDKKRERPWVIMNFIAYDEAGDSIARQMVDFVFENRMAFGDDGDWHLWTYRDLFLKRDGINFTDLAHEEIKKSVVVKPLPNADYTDELESFRFPSVSCLYGVSQPISQLRGSVKFLELFIQDGVGAYIAFDDNVVLYVGMSQKFSRRLCSAASHHKLKMIVQRHPDARVAVLHYPEWKLPEWDEIVTDAELNPLLARLRELLLGFERACIEHYQPRYNGRLLEEGTSDEVGN